MSSSTLISLFFNFTMQTRHNCPGCRNVLTQNVYCSTTLKNFLNSNVTENCSHRDLLTWTVFIDQSPKSYHLKCPRQLHLLKYCYFDCSQDHYSQKRTVLDSWTIGLVKMPSYGVTLVYVGNITHRNTLALCVLNHVTCNASAHNPLIFSVDLI